MLSFREVSVLRAREYIMYLVSLNRSISDILQVLKYVYVFSSSSCSRSAHCSPACTAVYLRTTLKVVMRSDGSSDSLFGILGCTLESSGVDVHVHRHPPNLFSVTFFVRSVHIARPLPLVAPPPAEPRAAPGRSNRTGVRVTGVTFNNEDIYHTRFA